ncbi:hypothetical protein [Photobacterium nomapromontoriensis]|uniref:hypothetical protein n=1 Tax=Photobacterium nomapromontoriensis TaxID=2910237 RepID=UPI003D0CABC1
MIKLAEDKVVVVAVDNDDDSIQSEVYICGKKVKEKLDGVILEDCYQYNDRYLLFLTNDIPHEDRLSMYYLDHELNVLDMASIGHAYTTGVFRKQVVVADNIITFHFFGNTKWVLTLLTDSKKRIPFFSDPKGVTRKFSWSCYFLLGGNPNSGY